MKLKVKQSLIYCGIVYNPGEVVDILESDIIERVKSLELVEAEEVTEEAENLEETAEEAEEAAEENTEVEETTEENTEVEETTEEKTEVEEINKNSKKSKKV
nr:MAG TPA: hypothetical protein [Caudoviricetes sp.]